MASRLNTRLDRLERRSDVRADDAQVDNVLSLIGRLEAATGQPLAVALHDMACPRGPSLAPVRAAGTVPDSEALAWFSNVTSRRTQLPALPPLCPLCSGPDAG